MRRYPQTFLRSFFILLFVVICLPLNEVSAQDFVTGAFLGQVVDSNGVPLPGVTIRVVNNETGVPTARQTDSKGNYRLGQLQPADYTITISKDGYVTQTMQRSLTTLKTTDVIPPVKLDPQSMAVVSPTPAESPTPETGNPPASKPTPQIVAATPMPDIRSEVNVTDARRDGVYSEREVSTLPLGGVTLTRSFDELGLLLPGVALPPQTQGSVTGPGVGAGVGSAGQFAVNGLRSRANNFTVDGSDNNDEDIGVRRQGFFALVPQPIESIREFQMITLLAPAQYGRNAGAQVNAVSKSGGNEYHGTVYGFLNTSQLNAANTFDTTTGNTRLPLQGRDFSGQARGVLIDFEQAFVVNDAGTKSSSTLGQGGLVLGGPLVPGNPNRPYHSLYFFLAAEGQFQHATEEASFAVPTVGQRGIFESGATGLLDTAGNPVFPTRIMGDAIFSLFPFPNNPSGVYGENTFTQALPNSAEGKVFSGKVNGNFKAFGRGHELVARYNFTDDWRDIAVTGGGIFSSLRPRVRTQNFSTFLNTPGLTNSISNQLRLSYGRTRLNFQERRDPSLLRSEQSPNSPFLLNRARLLNSTLPGDTDVFYFTSSTTERGDAFNVGTGPLGQVIISGFSPVGVDVFNFPQSRVNNTYQLADTINVQLGPHNVAFGADTRRTELNSELPRNARPLAVFGNAPPLPEAIFELSPTDLAALGSPTGFFSTLATSDSSIHLRYYQLNFFGQDEWRIRPNLSLSFGLRYEYNTVPREGNNRIESTFNAPELSLLPDLRTFIDGRSEIFEPDRNNFGPRVGFAYSPNLFGGHQTVIRAGYGLYYDQILGSVISQSRNVYPTFLTLNTAGGPTSVGGDPTRDFLLFNPNFSFSTGSVTRCSRLDNVCYTVPNSLNTLNHSLEDVVTFNRDARVGGFGLTLPERNLQTPMAHQYSAMIEQQLTGNLVVSAAYVGTLGRKLLRPTTPNLGPNVILIPQFVVAEDNQPVVSGIVSAPGNQPRRPFPTAGSVNIFTDDASSRYDAFQIQLRGRLARIVQLQANYVLSNVEDDASDVFDLAGAFALPQNSETFAGERGPASFDVRHRVSYNYIADFSSWGKKNTFLHAVLNGLEVAGTGIFQTGQPFTVNSIFDVNLDGNLTDRLNSTSGIVETDDRSQPLRLTVPAASLLAPLGQDGAVPRNSFRSSNLFLTNAAVIKKFSFSESTKLVFRTEFFNVFNRANFGIPVRYLEAPGFGKSVDTITPGRRIQFGLKLLF